MKTLYVTDFDDTLVKTDANVYATTAGGKQLTLSPEEYAVYDIKPGDKFDFSEFETLKNPKPIKRFVDLLKKVRDEDKADKIAVLTARGHTKPISKFLQSMGIDAGVSIAALGDSNPQRKANYIEKHINSGYDRVLFIDDSPKNINAVQNLRTKYPMVKLATHQVTSHPSIKQPQSPEKKLPADYYKPGETWITSGGNYGGKNKNGDYKYFDTQEKAKTFATT